MKLIDLIKQEKRFFSIEITPPFKNKPISSFFKTIDRIIPYNPAFINITYHPLKITKIKAEHSEQEIIIKKHADHLALCSAVKYKYNIEVVPHFVCAGVNKIEIEDTLIDFAFLDIKNILVLRGDPIQANAEFHPVDGGYSYASELVEHITKMKTAQYMNLIDEYKPIDFCVGVAGYPEKHFQAPSLEKDIDNLKRKVDAGADYIITQLCYDTNKWFDWVDKVRKYGINIPIIPGFKPLTSMQQIHTLKNVYNINIPPEIEKNMELATNQGRAWEHGIQHAIEFSNIFLNSGIHGIHYYTMGNGKDIEQLVSRSSIFA